MMQQTCLVLGANGFIGSHIVDQLASLGYKVIAFDRFSSEPQYSPHQNIVQVKGDIFSAADVAASLVSVDYFFHCFSATTPYSADLDPYTDITGNILNSARIFELCGEAKVKKVIFISSGGAIYGSTGEAKVATEDDAPLPSSPYGISKLATELYLAYFAKKFSYDHITYRLSNPYGPRQVIKHNQGVIPRFIQAIEAGETITMYGDGSSSRDYIYIGDVANIVADTFAKPNKHNIYNLGSGQQLSLIEIVTAIESTCSKHASVKHVPEPSSFVRRAQINVERLEYELGGVATTSFSKGISEAYNWLSESK